MTTTLAEARTAFAARDWFTAREAFNAARAVGQLEADDYFALAEATWFLGGIDESLQAFEEAHRLYVEEERIGDAAMAAMYLAEHATERGDIAIGSAWMNRARRLLQDQPESAEHGYPLYFETYSAMDMSDLDSALGYARTMQDLGHRFQDANLIALGVLGEGRALVKQGHVPDGMALLDEAMLAALSNELHPLWTGAVYCHLMDVCHELVDLRRASEWTQATERWCDTLPEAVFFRGICRVHRAQVFELRGEWEESERAATRASTDLAPLHTIGAAEAHYQIGEIRRLRGDAAGAEESFKRAHELGRDPHPGFALLRLAQGRIDAACTSLRTALTERAGDPLGRARLSSALVEVAVAAGETETARAAAAELRATAEAYGTSGLAATAQQALGRILLADAEAESALPVLRSACRLWQELEAPYEAARTRMLLADAYRALGDEDAMALKLDAAATTLARLGAELEARRAAEAQTAPAAPGGLSPREVEVLRLVAEGKTNRAIAEELFISDRTVGRHVSNIFAKLGLSSRSAATAYAFEHQLLDPARG